MYVKRDAAIITNYKGLIAFVTFLTFTNYILTSYDNIKICIENPVKHLRWSVLRKPLHCVKSVRIRSFSGPYFPVFWLKT